MTAQTLFKIQEGSFSYGENTVFTNLNFELHCGKFYGLIGPNGSGKSTLIDILMNINTLNRGTISLHDVPLSSYSRSALAKILALVPQQFNIGFDFSVKEIVLMGRHPHIPRFSLPTDTDLGIVDEALRSLDIYHLKDRSVIHLSGGEKQRVIVARALAQKTKALLLDEATANLDIEHTINIMRILRKMVDAQNITVIAAIHDLNMAAAFCDEIIVLKNAEIHALGDVKNTLTPQLIESIFSVKCSVDIHEKGYPLIQFRMQE